jgi:hypothetical protein
MKRHLILGSAGLLLAAAACNRSPAHEQEEARNAQQKADEKSSQYRMQAEEKSAEQQAVANDKAREATRTLDTVKNDYRHKAQSDLDGLTKDIDDLRVKAEKATGKTRQDLDRGLADLTARRDAVEAQIRSIDSASAEQLETVKARVDDQIAQLRKSVKDVEKRI